MLHSLSGPVNHIRNPRPVGFLDREKGQSVVVSQTGWAFMQSDENLPQEKAPAEQGKRKHKRTEEKRGYENNGEAEHEIKKIIDTHNKL
jgi:hypothetical protein